MNKILLIDDDEAFCMVVKSMIKEIGFPHVIIARSGLDGIAAAKREKPNIILLDIVMPGIDGLEVLQLLKSKPRTKNIPVIMLTGVDDQLPKERALYNYAQVYLTKPITLKSLRSSFQQILI